MIRLPCDVLVVGAGPAGLAAAVSAGRAGARVVLLERRGVVGGLATAGPVGTVCGLYLRDSTGAPPRLAAGGFPGEVAEHLARASGTSPLRLGEGLWVLPYAPRAFERLGDELLRGAGAVELVLHATLAGVAVEGDRAVGARALAWGDELTVEPLCVVDATGEATAAALAGGATEDGTGEQAPALAFRLDGADPAALAKGPLPVLLALARGVREGVLSPGCERLSPVPGSAADGASTWKLGLALGRPGAGEPAWRQVTAWEREGRARVDEIERFLAGHVAGFGGARLGAVAAEVGVRSGRRVRGRATLTETDVLGGARYPDGVARGAWPVERWEGGPRPRMAWAPEGSAYEVRLGCLRPLGLENVYAAGRCLSAEPGAQASARVIGTALATGWAAGALAACQAAGGAPEDAVAGLRQAWEGAAEPW